MSSEPPSITLDVVRHLAVLARLDLDDDHLVRLSGELEVILQSVAKVSEVAADDIPPTSHPLPLTNVARPDVEVPCLSVQDALSAAPEVESGRFRVPRILDEG
jgi:aspartyl-tRNA(Asn)/glutamyl-tRNA(Gln) amidotransferase subunit C